MISIIIPMYNSSDTIIDTIKSVLQQKYKNIEVVVVDDGSSDDSFSKVKECFQSNDQVKILRQDNKGVSAARNLGISKSTGEYLTFVDADDQVSEDIYINLLNSLKEFNSDITFTNIEIVDFNGKSHLENNLGNLKLAGKQILDQFLPRFLAGNDYDYESDLIKGSVCRILVRSDIIRKGNITFMEELTYMEDLIFILQVLLVSNRVSTIDSYDYYYIHRSNSTVFSYQQNLFQQFDRTQKIIVDLVNHIDNENIKKRLQIRKFNLLKTFHVNLCHSQNPDSYLQKIQSSKLILSSNLFDLSNGKIYKNSSLKNRIIYFLFKRKISSAILAIYR